MDEAQVTGATSSYARKYALNGLFAIDDTKDADVTNTHGKDEQVQPKTAKQPIIVERVEKFKKFIKNIVKNILCSCLVFLVITIKINLTKFDIPITEIVPNEAHYEVARNAQLVFIEVGRNLANTVL